MMDPEFYIETPRLILRRIKPADHEGFIAMNLDEDVAEFFPAVLTAAETLAQIERIDNHIAQYGYGRFAVERKDNHQFIGFIGLAHATIKDDEQPFAEIGWRLSKNNWNRGFATEAAKACLEHGFNTLGLDEICSFTAVLNKRSERVMIKLGMEKDSLFEHPLIADGHVLKPHVLYKINRYNYNAG